MLAARQAVVARRWLRFEDGQASIPEFREVALGGLGGAPELLLDVAAPQIHTAAELVEYPPLAIIDPARVPRVILNDPGSGRGVMLGRRPWPRDTSNFNRWVQPIPGATALNHILVAASNVQLIEEGGADPLAQGPNALRDRVLVGAPVKHLAQVLAAERAVLSGVVLLGKHLDDPPRVPARVLLQDRDAT